jgi:hypothetical protein
MCNFPLPFGASQKGFHVIREERVQGYYLLEPIFAPKGALLLSWGPSDERSQSRKVGSCSSSVEIRPCRYSYSQSPLISSARILRRPVTRQGRREAAGRERHRTVPGAKLLG